MAVVPVGSALTFSGEDLDQKIASREARVGIIGMGYVGLPLALLFSGERFPVTGFDVDTEKVRALENCQPYIARITKQEIEDAREHGFTATGNYKSIGAMDAIIVCVPTPLDDYRAPDL